LGVNGVGFVGSRDDWFASVELLDVVEVADIILGELIKNLSLRTRCDLIDLTTK
jgi:hypothetical protein